MCVYDDDDVYDACNDDEVIAPCRGASYSGIQDTMDWCVGRGVTRKRFCSDTVRIGKDASRHENVVMIIKTIIFYPFKLMIFTRFACHHGALYALYVMTDDDVV